MNNLTLRAITGAILVAVLVGSLVYGALPAAALFFVISMLSLHEFYVLMKGAGYQPNRLLGMAYGAVMYTFFVLRHNDRIEDKTLLLLVPLAFFFFLPELFNKHEKPFEQVAMSLLGPIYAVLPFVFFVQLGYITGTGYNYQIPLGFLFLLWSSDTFAYVFGRMFGKTKLFERISPKKTWEGFAGGLFSAIAVSQILARYFDALSPMNWAAVALIVVIFGSLGDLVESLFKRSINVKDSGTILPGHGGLLDRFDGLLIAAPMVFIYLMLIN